MWATCQRPSTNKNRLFIKNAFKGSISLKAFLHDRRAHRCGCTKKPQCLHEHCGMAESEGFKPPIPEKGYTGFRVQRIRSLCQLSFSEDKITHIIANRGRLHRLTLWHSYNLTIRRPNKTIFCLYSSSTSYSELLPHQPHDCLPQ